MKPYLRGYFTPERITKLGDAGIYLCAAAVLYMAATQFAVGCHLIP